MRHVLQMFQLHTNLLVLSERRPSLTGVPGSQEYTDAVVRDIINSPSITYPSAINRCDAQGGGGRRAAARPSPRSIMHAFHRTESSQSHDVAHHVNTLRELIEQLTANIERSRRLAPLTSGEFLVRLHLTSTIHHTPQRTLTLSAAQCSGAVMRLCQDAVAPDPTFDPARDLATVARTCTTTTMQRQRSSHKESSL